MKQIHNKCTVYRIIYVNCPNKTLNRERLHKNKKDCLNRVDSDQMVCRRVIREVGPREGCRERRPKALKTKLAQGGHQACFNSDQMVFVMARQEAESSLLWPKALKWRVGKQLLDAKGPNREQA
jgi:hypothetical protein